MARIRSVHPGLFTDADWVECSMPARLLIIGLWTHADDQGLFVWRPKEIKMNIFPGDNVEIEPLLMELSRNGLIKAYDHDGKGYGAIRNFRRWQRPQKPNAIHPLPELIADYVGLNTPQSDSDTSPVNDRYDTDTVAVADQYDSGTRNPIQREDGGGIGRGRGSKKEKTEKEKRPTRRSGRLPPDDRPKAVWRGDPAFRKRVVDIEGEGFACAYIDPSTPLEGGGLKATTGIAAERLRASRAMVGIRVLGP